MDLKAFKIKTRLWMGFGAVILLFIVSGIITIFQLSKAEYNTKQVKNDSLPYALLAKDMAFQVIEVQQFLTDVSATHNTEGYKDAENAANHVR